MSGGHVHKSVPAMVGLARVSMFGKSAWEEPRLHACMNQWTGDRSRARWGVQVGSGRQRRIQQVGREEESRGVDGDRNRYRVEKEGTLCYAKGS